MTKTTTLVLIGLLACTIVWAQGPQDDGDDGGDLEYTPEPEDEDCSTCCFEPLEQAENCCKMPAMVDPAWTRDCAKTLKPNERNQPHCVLDCVFKAKKFLQEGDILEAAVSAAFIKGVSKTWAEAIPLVVESCALSAESLHYESVPEPPQGGAKCDYKADAFMTCVRHVMMTNCPDEYMNKTEASCPDKVKAVDACNPLKFRMYPEAGSTLGTSTAAPVAEKQKEEKKPAASAKGKDKKEAGKGKKDAKKGGKGDKGTKNNIKVHQADIKGGAKDSKAASPDAKGSKGAKGAAASDKAAKNKKAAPANAKDSKGKPTKSAGKTTPEKKQVKKG